MVKTVEDFARGFGFGRDLFYQAAEIHKLLASNKKFDWAEERKALTLREYYEPRIMDDDSKPVGLGAVIAGIGAEVVAEHDCPESRTGNWNCSTMRLRRCRRGSPIGRNFPTAIRPRRVRKSARRWRRCRRICARNSRRRSRRQTRKRGPSRTCSQYEGIQTEHRR